MSVKWSETVETGGKKKINYPNHQQKILFHKTCFIEISMCIPGHNVKMYFLMWVTIKMFESFHLKSNVWDNSIPILISALRYPRNGIILTSGHFAEKSFKIKEDKNPVKYDTKCEKWFKMFCLNIGLYLLGNWACQKYFLAFVM